MSLSTDSNKFEGADRPKHLSQAKNLAIVTIVWNMLESAATLYFGIAANSVSLTGYGIDGALESTSAVVMMWRLKSEEASKSGDGEDGKASKILGALLMLLCIYIAFDSITTLMGIQDKAEASWPGILITLAGLVVTPVSCESETTCFRKVG